MNLINYSDSESEDQSIVENKEFASSYQKWLQEDSESEDENLTKNKINKEPNKSSSIFVSPELLFSVETSEKNRFIDIDSSKKKFEVPAFNSNNSKVNYKKDSKLVISSDVIIDEINNNNSGRSNNSKKDICQHYVKGNCKHGTLCKFSHIIENIVATGKKIKTLEKETVKDKVKRQRLAGQTGIQGGWKSEEEMRQRQQFD